LISAVLADGTPADDQDNSRAVPVQPAANQKTTLQRKGRRG
jgi:hypothetical protein